MTAETGNVENSRRDVDPAGLACTGHTDEIDLGPRKKILQQSTTA